MPAPIVNGGGDRFWKWKEFKLSRARDLDLDLWSGHTAYRRASLIDLYLPTKFHWNRRNFLWTDGRTYGRTFFSPLILLGRLLEVDLKRAFFTFLGYLRLSCAQPTGNSFTPNQWYRTDGKPRLESVTRHKAEIGPWRVPKSGHVTITKIENLRIDTRRKIRFQKCYSFRSTTNNNEVIAENPFQNSGVTMHLWTLGRLELTLVVNTSF